MVLVLFSHHWHSDPKCLPATLTLSQRIVYDSACDHVLNLLTFTLSSQCVEPAEKESEYFSGSHHEPTFWFPSGFDVNPPVGDFAAGTGTITILYRPEQCEWMWVNEHLCTPAALVQVSDGTYIQTSQWEIESVSESLSQWMSEQRVQMCASRSVNERVRELGIVLNIPAAVSKSVMKRMFCER